MPETTDYKSPMIYKRSVRNELVGLPFDMPIIRANMLCNNAKQQIRSRAILVEVPTNGLINSTSHSNSNRN